MNVGDHFTSRFSVPHRLDVTIVALEEDHLVADTIHRCAVVGCYLQTMRQTLPIHGRLRYDYESFARMFLWMNPDAIPLGPAR